MIRIYKSSLKHLLARIVIALVCPILNQIILPEASNAENINRPTATDQSLAQIIRRLIDLPQTVAAGGSRSKTNQKNLCLMTPIVEQDNKRMKAYALTSKPVIAANQPLNEMVIKDIQGTILKKLVASSKENVSTPILWPISPIKAGEIFIIELRGINYPAGEKAIIMLTGLNDEEKIKNDTIQSSFNSPELSTERRLNILKTTNRRLAMQMLFNSKDENLNSLREILISSCTNKDASPEIH